MAVIVEYSRKPVKKKIAAWQRIIDDHPDMPISGNVTFKPKESLHKYLKMWIALHEKCIADFHSSGKGAFYRAAPFHADRADEFCYGYHSTVQKALAAVHEDEPKATKIRIVKETIDKEGSDIAALFNSKGELLEIYDLQCEIGDELHYAFIHLPVPFEKGDIVSDGRGFPMVLVSLNAWTKEWCEEMLAGNSLDGSDQCGLAFASDSFFGHPANHEHPCTYHLEYYKKELQGQDRFLKAFSQYVKDKDKDNCSSNTVHLIGAFRKYQAEADAERLSKVCWDQWFA
jgi:hypothetical protein